MKRLFTKIGAILTLSIVLYIVVIFLFTFFGFNRWLPNAKNTTGRGYYTYSRLQELQRINDIDILFIGSSHMYRGVDTRVFDKAGIATFNLGTSGQTPYNTYYLLQEHLERTQPETIVMDVYLEGMNSDGVGAAIEIVSNHELTENMLLMASKDFKFETASSLLSIYISRYHTPLSDVTEVKPKNDSYIPGGYIETSRITNELTQRQLNNLKRHSIEMNELQKSYLDKIIDLCDKRDIELVLIVPPLTREFKGKIYNYEVFLKELRDTLESKKVTIIDYNSQVTLNLNTFHDFLDANHLNPNGAVKFSNALLQDLKKEGIINSHKIHVN